MKVLASTDGSDYSLKALRKLGNLLPKEGTKVLMVSAFPSPRTLTYGPDPYNVSYDRMADQFRDKAESDAKAAQAILVEQGFEVETLTMMGNPAEVLIDLAKSEKADLIVVGSHGKSGLQRFLLGSVSDKVTRYAPCSILVVRLPEEEA